MKKVIAFLLCMVLTLSIFSIESNAATEWIDINEVRIENVGEIVAGRTTNFVLSSAEFPEYIRIGQVLCRDYEADAQSWARDAVYFMNGQGIIKGVGARAGYGNNCFGPLEKSTREQALLIAVRCTETFK